MVQKSRFLLWRKFLVLLFLGVTITCFLNLFFDGLQYLVFGNYIDPSDTLPAGVGGTKAGLLRYLFKNLEKLIFISTGSTLLIPSRKHTNEDPQDPLVTCGI